MTQVPIRFDPNRLRQISHVAAANRTYRARVEFNKLLTRLDPEWTIDDLMTATGWNNTKAKNYVCNLRKNSLVERCGTIYKTVTDYACRYKQMTIPTAVYRKTRSETALTKGLK